MATSTDAMILAALIERLETLVFAPPLPIAYPGVDFPLAGEMKSKPYIALAFLPNQTRQITLGDDPQQKRGLFQATVVWARGQGLVKPLDAAGRIIGHFNNQVLWAGEVRVTIAAEPWAAAPLQDDDRVRVPVTVPYFAFEPEV
jgi:hypothetical protein